MADLDDPFKVLSHSRRHGAVPGTVTLSRIVCEPSPPALTEARKGVTRRRACRPGYFPEPNGPCDILVGWIANIHYVNLLSSARNTIFPTPGGASLRRKPRAGTQSGLQ